MTNQNNQNYIEEKNANYSSPAVKNGNYEIIHSVSLRRNALEEENTLTYDIKNPEKGQKYTLKTHYKDNDRTSSSSIEFLQDGKSLAKLQISALHNVDFESVDCMMEVYKEVQHINPRNKQQEAEKQLIIKSLDRFIFNTPESREVLAEFLHQPTEIEIKKAEKMKAYKEANAFHEAREEANARTQENNETSQNKPLSRKIKDIYQNFSR